MSRRYKFIGLVLGLVLGTSSGFAWAWTLAGTGNARAASSTFCTTTPITVYQRAADGVTLAANVQHASPNVNSSTFAAGWTSSTTAASERWALFKYTGPLPAVPSVGGNACHLVSATLHLDATLPGSGSGARTLLMTKTATTWTNAVTWNTKPTEDTRLSTTTTPAVSNTLTFGWDVTPFVDGWRTAGVLSVEIRDATWNNATVATTFSASTELLVLTYT